MEEEKKTAQEAFDELNEKTSTEAGEAAKEAISKGKSNPKVGLYAFALKDELEAIEGYVDIANELKKIGDIDGLNAVYGIVCDEIRHCKTLKGLLGDELIDTDEKEAVDKLDEAMKEAFEMPKNAND